MTLESGLGGCCSAHCTALMPCFYTSANGYVRKHVIVQYRKHHTLAYALRVNTFIVVIMRVNVFIAVIMCVNAFFKHMQNATRNMHLPCSRFVLYIA